MLKKIPQIIKSHINDNKHSYIILFLLYIGGILAGAFAVNGLSNVQKSEMLDYFKGFVELFSNHPANPVEILKMSAFTNYSTVLILCISAISIIGFPIVYLLIAGKGFLTGFSSGLIMGVAGAKGIVFAMIGLLPKEIVIVPCTIAIGVCSINYSISMLRNKNEKKVFEEHAKEVLAYFSVMTFLFSILMFLGVLIESYVIPVLIRIFLPIFK